MGLGAIVVVAAGSESFESAGPRGAGRDCLLAEPLACVHVMGRSILERTIERFVHAGVDIVSVVAAEEYSSAVLSLPVASDKVRVQAVANISSAINQELQEYMRAGIEHTFVISANAYAETDLLDMFYFHREARQTATRALDREGPLDLWVVDCLKGQGQDLEKLQHGEQGGASYFIREYVNRVQQPADLRRLVSDALRGHCALRPSGLQVKPGIWIDEGAEVHRRARIVAPAYIGRGSKVKQDTLITRCSSIEAGCCIDYGTVIEDSSILANTHIGIWLDVCHAVAHGNKLLSLGRNVMVEIPDPGVMRFGVPVREEPSKLSLSSSSQQEYREHREQEELVAEFAEQKSPRPDAWQFGTNLIQG